MIFVTVGSMFPFDRLIRAMDAFAEAHPARDVEAQIGEGRFEPRHMRWQRSLARRDFDATVRRADLVVAHAGVGTVMTACRLGTPLVILARRRHLGEHTSDHQVETAQWLRAKPGIHVAEDEAGLAGRIAAAEAEQGAGAISATADPALIARIRAFIEA